MADEEYTCRHRNAINLLIHIAAVPIFILGLLAGVVAVANLRPVWFGVGIALVVYSLLMQKWGHAQEAIPPVPFTNAGDALVRIFKEQFLTFPGFVLDGGWLANWRAAQK